MKASSRSKRLTASVTAKITSEEKTLIKTQALEAGLSCSEWSRQALLQATEYPSNLRLLLAELMALRRIFLRLQSDANKVNELVKEADGVKFSMADKRILEAQSAQKGEAV